jgi:hypothetical protein
MVANGGPSSMRYITIPLGCSAYVCVSGGRAGERIHQVHYLIIESR